MLLILSSVVFKLSKSGLFFIHIFIAKHDATCKCNLTSPPSNHLCEIQVLYSVNILLYRHYIALKYGVAIHLQSTLNSHCSRMLCAMVFFKIPFSLLPKNLLLKDYDYISIEDCYVFYPNTPIRGLAITERLLLKFLYSYA